MIEENGIIALVEFIFLPASGLKGKKEFKVERRDDEPLIYSDIQQVKDDYAKDIVRILQFPLDELGPCQLTPFS